MATYIVIYRDKYLIRTIFSVLTKICGSSIIFNFIFLFEKKLNGYDVAISFTNNVNDKSVYFGCNKFVLDKVSAKKKISWLHTDYNVIKSKYNSKEYKRFDKIVAVSKFGANTLVKNVPELEDKVTVIKNVINGDEICNKATLFNAEIAEGVPQKLEHNDIQWITPAEISRYDFCPADEEILQRITQTYHF